MAIERKFIEQNMREFKIKQFVADNVLRVGLSEVNLKKTPLGDKIIIHASRPGLVVGRGGSNIQELSKKLKAEFDLENPQIEIEEVEEGDLDADIVAERIANSLERFGAGRTKGIGHRTLRDVMEAGALGVEIIISGKIPSMRSRNWRFYSGYLKKAGNLAIEGVRSSTKTCTLKSGAVGIKVKIMPPDLRLPDDIELLQQPTTTVEATDEETATEEADAAGGEQKGKQSTPDGEPRAAKEDTDKKQAEQPAEESTAEESATEEKE